MTLPNARRPWAKVKAKHGVHADAGNETVASSTHHKKQCLLGAVRANVASADASRVVRFPQDSMPLALLRMATHTTADTNQDNHAPTQDPHLVDIDCLSEAHTCCPTATRALTACQVDKVELAGPVLNLNQRLPSCTATAGAAAEN